MPKTSSDIPASVLDAYERLVATLPNVERKGATMPYTSVNGNMFSFITKEGTVALRLPASAREEFLENHRTKLCEQHGKVLAEYVEIPDALLAKTELLRSYFAASYEYTASLKPKPTRTASGKG